MEREKEILPFVVLVDELDDPAAAVEPSGKPLARRSLLVRIILRIAATTSSSVIPGDAWQPWDAGSMLLIRSPFLQNKIISYFDSRMTAS